jgi:uncharacterized damage-inducible protein DinB
MDLGEGILGAWETSHRTTVFLVRELPGPLWSAEVPEVPRRTIRSIAAHIHNCRRNWIRTLGEGRRIAVPARVDPFRVRQRELVRALDGSGAGLRRLLQLGIDSGGKIPTPPHYAWRNLPLDVAHVLSYFVAHEGHHRGQIVLAARQLGHRLPVSITGGLWAWSRRVREARP